MTEKEMPQGLFSDGVGKHIASHSPFFLIQL
jgi:hypothetical protein